MQKLITITFLLLLMSGITYSQQAARMNYQAVLRNANSEIIADQNVEMIIQLIKDHPRGETVYEELHELRTNQNGLFTAIIGDGEVLFGSMEDIQWGSSSFYIKTLVDPDGGSNYSLEGVTEILSVPFAMYAASGGEPGPQGIQGIPGAQGPQGDRGPEGPQGPAGPKGEDGAGVNIIGSVGNVQDLEANYQGSVGDMYILSTTGQGYVWDGTSWVNVGQIQGPQGPVGPQGPQGLTGAQGPVGPVGPQGLKGDTGATGSVGPIGPQGIPGMEGPPGPKGDQGDPGPEGPVGPQGQTGAMGLQGPKGDQGDPGPMGQMGPQGPAGASGPQGNPGQIGPVGPPGPQGEPGMVGPQGLQGPVGPQGPQGPAGNISGPAGGDLTGSFPNPGIANNSITTPRIANGAVTSIKIADESITTNKLALQAVDANRLANASVTSTKLVDGAVSNTKLAVNAITTSKILNAAVTGPKLANNAVTTDKIANGAVTADKLAPGIGGSNWSTSGNHVYRPGGRVGINTSTPNEYLDITHNQGFVRAGNALFPVQVGTNSSALRYMVMVGPDYHTMVGGMNDRSIIGSVNNKLEIGTNPVTPSIFLGTNGKVGIGGYSTDATLHVEGTIRTGDFGIYFGEGTAYGFRRSGNLLISYSGIEPFAANLRDLGTSTYRWRTIYLTNQPNVGSDARIKENITPLNYGLDAILKLKPVQYNLIGNNALEVNLGLIAQEVKEIIPEVVSVDITESPDVERTGKHQPPKDFHSMRYAELIPVLIKAVQEQNTLIEKLEARIAVLENN